MTRLLLFFLLLSETLLCSCNNIDSYQYKIKKIKEDTTNKKVSFFENGLIHEVIDKSRDTLFVGSMFEFDKLKHLKEYAFLCNSIKASYIEHFNDKGKMTLAEGKPIVYCFTTPDFAKDSMFMKRYVSTFSYKNVEVETAGLDGKFTKANLNDEPNLSFIKSFQTYRNVKDAKRFVFITKFSGRRIDNDSLEIFYDTIDVTRRE